MRPKIPNKLEPKLKDGQRITIIGLGGVGEKVARNLALFVASLKTPAVLTLVDGDQFSPSNSSRAMFSDFGNKAEVVSNELLPGFIADGSKLEIKVVPEYITPANMATLLMEDDIILLCVDNHRTRKIVSDWVGTLRNAVLISAGNDGVEPEHGMRGTFSNVQVYLRKDGQDVTEPLGLLHPEISDPKDKLPTEKSCTEMMLSVPQLLLANLSSASILLNALNLYLCGCLHYSELCVDIADGKMNPVIDIEAQPDADGWNQTKADDMEFKSV